MWGGESLRTSRETEDFRGRQSRAATHERAHDLPAGHRSGASTPRTPDEIIKEETVSAVLERVMEEEGVKGADLNRGTERDEETRERDSGALSILKSGSDGGCVKPAEPREKGGAILRESEAGECRVLQQTVSSMLFHAESASKEESGHGTLKEPREGIAPRREPESSDTGRSLSSERILTVAWSGAIRRRSLRGPERKRCPCFRKGAGNSSRASAARRVRGRP